VSLAAFIADQRTTFDVPHVVACRALTVSESCSTSGTLVNSSSVSPPWPSRGGPRSTRPRRSVQGSPRPTQLTRIHTDLRAAGWVVSEKTVAKSMARPRFGRPNKEAAEELDPTG